MTLSCFLVSPLSDSAKRSGSDGSLYTLACLRLLLPNEESPTCPLRRSPPHLLIFFTFSSSHLLIFLPSHLLTFQPNPRPSLAQSPGHLVSPSLSPSVSHLAPPRLCGNPPSFPILTSSLFLLTFIFYPAFA